MRETAKQILTRKKEEIEQDITVFREALEQQKRNVELSREAIADRQAELDDINAALPKLA